MNTDIEKNSTSNDTTPEQKAPITEELTQTAILRLKAADTSAQKTESRYDTGYSITETYQQAVSSQQASLSRQRRNLHTFKVVKITVSSVVLLAAIIGSIYFAMNHLPSFEESRSIEAQLMDSKWNTDSIGNFDFTDSHTVTRKISGKIETGTYELTDANVLIMRFSDDELSYLIEFDSDGNMRWIHSYNGFEDIIYPTSIPKADAN